MSCPLPLEILEKILSYADAETLLKCEDISPELTAAVNYFTYKSIWRECCSAEMKRHDIKLQITGKLYPHHPHFDCPRTWRAIYRIWFNLRKLTNISRWNLTKFSVTNRCCRIVEVSTHGNLLLALIKYKKTLKTYYRIITINEENVLLHKSCRFRSDTLYLTPLEGSRIEDDNVLLHCSNCKLIGIPPTKKHAKRKNYPKIALGTNKINVFHSNGEYLFFRNRVGMLDKSKCGSLKENGNLSTATCFVRVICNYSSLHISCDDVYREFVTIQSLQSKVTASKFFASVLFLGTETGMLYGYFCKDKYDILHLNLKEYDWCFNLSTRAIISIDLMVCDHRIEIICSDSISIFRLFPYINTDLSFDFDNLNLPY